MQPEADLERIFRTVFAWLPGNATRGQVLDYFSPVGTVNSITCYINSYGRQYGYIEFDDVNSVPLAVDHSCVTELLGQSVSVIPPGPDDAASKRLYIEGLDLDVTADELEKFFRPFGNMESVKLEDDATTQSKGFAVQFARAYTVEMILHGRVVFRNKVSVVVGPSRLRMTAVEGNFHTDTRRSFSCCFPNLSSEYKRDGYVDEDLEDSRYYHNDDMYVVHWPMPEVEKWVVNIDSSSSSDHQFGYACILRDCNGDDELFVYGNVMDNVKSTVFKEGFGLLRALRIIRKPLGKNPSLLIISDNLGLINLLNEEASTADERLKLLILTILALVRTLFDTCRVEYTWYCRETNYVADRLAHMGLKLKPNEEKVTTVCDDWTVQEFIRRDAGIGFFHNFAPKSTKEKRTFRRLYRRLPSLKANPSEFVLFKNLFDSAIDDFDEIKAALLTHCAKFGTVNNCYIYKGSAGIICLKFQNVEQAAKCIKVMHSNWFCCRFVEATFVGPERLIHKHNLARHARAFLKQTSWYENNFQKAREIIKGLCDEAKAVGKDSICEKEIRERLKNTLTKIPESLKVQLEGQVLDAFTFEGQVNSPGDYNPSPAATLRPSPILDLAAAGISLRSADALEGPDRIFVGGLPYNSTKVQIQKLLELVGPVRGLDLVRDKRTGGFKGRAFCVYQDVSVTDTACTKLNGRQLGNRTITVRRANQGTALPKPEQEFVLLQAQQVQQQLTLQRVTFQAGAHPPNVG